MKRLVIGIAAVAAVALALTGCSGTTTAKPTGKPSLLIMVDTPRVPQAQEYKKLMAKTENITIQVIAQTDVQTKVDLHNKTKSGWPDVIFGAPQDTAAFEDPSNGYALNLTKLLPANVAAGFKAGNTDCVFNGQTYCLKNDLANNVLWYNTKIFKQLGLTVPKTMAEFAATAMKLKGTGYSAGAYGDQNYYASFLQSSGCPLAQVPKPNVVRIAPSDPKCTRVAKLLQPLLDAGVIDKRSSSDPSFLADVAQKDKVAMTIGPSWFGDFIIEPAASWNVPAGEIAAAPMPAWGSGSDNTSGAWGGGSWTVSSHSKYQQAAVNAAIWLTTSTWMAEAKTTPTYPAYGPANAIWVKKQANDPYFANNTTTAMTAGASNINQGDRPVRFAFVNEIGTVLQADINSGKPLSTALNDFAHGLQQLAPLSGYKVITK
jgi:ABC-type glycerol-3-phosphate transport system substrate-binding protein